MNNECVKETIISICTEVFEISDVDKKMVEFFDLKNDLGMDSITFITLIVFLEERFNIIIPDELLDYEAYNCVRDVETIVRMAMSNSFTCAEENNNVET